ncbi:Defective in germ line development protein 3 [Caenorhabditis elegans]|uniref:Defective in germ line development protein 3 n=1 Tax=Caenorhabditis elegans TaxID=6239 RepID=GLD3_CAEEL|nr:Defective in germ line development protein 3 [Caenorhabditis elegans]Q95ZK7.2 RecName: Full=Defective in germ line development protein 3; AltName: Full=Germline development defective 3 [Caenorhabditis elegans]CCD65918.1 Defective in germ line development protein 3 [Caenorhabditis elegans]|eukprot:NP_495479.2 Defective in germ line development protein 3 [Caenorhabditis elegans]
MGEQSHEKDHDEAHSYNPFVRSAVEYDADTRLQMAENAASARKLFVSSALKDIIVNPENFYHDFQQSAQMAEDANQRRQVSYNTKREAHIHQLKAQGLPLPSNIPMIEINPTRVTLNMEFESQYYSLMTSDNGDHENVASIMAETNTLIQLPDRSVGGTTPDPFAQQVTITGYFGDVDRARMLMRRNCHFTVFMALSKMKMPLHELQAHVRQNPIQNVEMSFVDAPEKNGIVTTYLRITAREKNQHELIEAAKRLNEILFRESPAPENNFTLHFTLSTYYVDQVLGSSSTAQLMPVIERETTTIISYPCYNNRNETRGNIYEIKVVGNIDNVLKARRYIMDLLPISMCFNIKNTDMAEPSRVSDRNIHMIIDESGIILKMTPSVYEPADLLSGEVPLNCASLRSKEFNIKKLYTAYQKVLSKKFDFIAPQPNDYDNSIWHHSLPANFLKNFNMPCRGELSDGSNGRRHRSSSIASSRSKHSYMSKGKQFSESSGGPSRSHTRVSSFSENSSTVPIMQFPTPHFAPPMLTPHHHMLKYVYLQQHQQAQTFLKGAAGLHPGTHIMFPPPIIVDGSFVSALPFADPVVFDGFPYVHGLFPVNEAEQHRNHRESSPSLRSTQEIRKPSRNMGNRPSSSTGSYYPSTTPRQRVYEQVREDDLRSHIGSRRTSVNGDDQNVESMHDQGYERQYPRQHQRLQKDDQQRWKTGSRGDIHSSRTINVHRDVRNSNEYDFHVGNSGPAKRSPSLEQVQLQMTHHLKLKSNDVDLDHEKLYMHESPHNDSDTTVSASGFGNDLMDGDFVQRFLSNANINESGRRPRTVSCFTEKDGQSARYIDSDGAYSVVDHASTHQSRSYDSFRKVGDNGVTKTILEPRARVEKDYGKISLEHKTKYSNEYGDEEKSAENDTSSLGSRQYRIDPMKLIASVRESSEQLPRIHERQFSDVLNEKEKEIADKSIESTVTQDLSLDETSTY